MKKRRLSALLTLLILLTVTILTSCGGGDGDERLTYAGGTVLRLSFGDGIVFFDDSLAGDGVRLTDGRIYHSGEAKPVFSEIARALSVVLTSSDGASSIADTDIIKGTLDELFTLSREGKLVDLSDYLEYMPALKEYLESNASARISATGEIPSLDIFCAPLLSDDYTLDPLPFIRSDWIKALLNGEGAYTCETAGTVGEIHYTPYMPTSGSVEITVADGNGNLITLTKNYTVAGNIAESLNLAAEYGELSGVDAVNMLRCYIDDAYGGYYGTDRADLFIGANAAWDADELVSLLRCVKANLSSLYPEDTSAAMVGAQTDLIRLSGMLFGVRGLSGRDDYLYLDSNSTLHDARAEESTYVAIEKMNSIVSEGLIAVNSVERSEKSTYPSFMYFGVPNDISNMTALLPPVALWYDGTADAYGVDTGRYFRLLESSDCTLTTGLAISAEGVRGDKDKLHAALRFIDYLYSDSADNSVSIGPSDFLSIDNQNKFRGEMIPAFSDGALDDAARLTDGDVYEYATEYLGASRLFDNDAMLRCVTSDGVVSESEDKYYSAICCGAVETVKMTVSKEKWYVVPPLHLPLNYTEETVINMTGLGREDFEYSFDMSSSNVLFLLAMQGYSEQTFPDRDAAITYFTVSRNGEEYLLTLRNAWDRSKVYFE